MFNRVTTIATGTADLFRAEGELLIERSRRLLSFGILSAVAGMLAGFSLLALAVAGTAWLSTLIGWIAAVAVAGVVGLSLSGTTAVLIRASASKSLRLEQLPPDPRARAEQARARITNGDARGAQQDSSPANTSTTSEKSGGDNSDSFADRVAEYVVNNPGASVAGISAALAVLGPGTTLKYAGRAMMVAKLAQKMVEHATSGDSDRSSDTTRSSSPPAHSDPPRSHPTTASAGRTPTPRHHHAPTNGQR